MTTNNDRPRWQRGNAKSEADYERRLLLAYEIILSHPLPEPAVPPGTDQVEQTEPAA